MTITVTPNLTDISLCEVITGWSSCTINAIDQIQGTNYIGLVDIMTVPNLKNF